MIVLKSNYLKPDDKFNNGIGNINRYNEIKAYYQAVSSIYEFK